MTAGHVVYACESWQSVWYENGAGNKGCYYNKCANGYALQVSNWLCEQGHCGSNTWAPGYPVCPHGDTLETSYHRDAHCHHDSGWDKPGYRAP